MRVGVNALAAHSEGALTYLLNLIPELIDINASLQLFIYANSDIAKQINDGINITDAINFRIIYGIENALKRIIWEHHRLDEFLRKDAVDVLYCPIPPSPLRCSVPVVVAIRNMAPFCPRVWELSNRFDRFRYIYIRLAVWLTLHRASEVIIVSKASHSLLTKKYNLPERRITIIFHGKNIDFFPLPKENSLQYLKDFMQLPDDFILYTSPTYPYKNHLELIDAISILKNRWSIQKHLVIAGRQIEPFYSLAFQKVKDLGIEKQVHFMGNVDYSLLPYLNNSADIFVFPSICEACPNTLVEVMACGVPLAVSDLPVMREICQDGAIYFDPFAPASIAKAIYNLINDIPKQRELSKKSLERADHFSWEKTAQQTFDVFKRSANNANR